MSNNNNNPQRRQSSGGGRNPQQLQPPNMMGGNTNANSNVPPRGGPGEIFPPTWVHQIQINPQAMNMVQQQQLAVQQQQQMVDLQNNAGVKLDPQQLLSQHKMQMFNLHQQLRRHSSGGNVGQHSQQKQSQQLQPQQQQQQIAQQQRQMMQQQQQNSNYVQQNMGGQGNNMQQNANMNVMQQNASMNAMQQNPNMNVMQQNANINAMQQNASMLQQMNSMQGGNNRAPIAVQLPPQAQQQLQQLPPQAQQQMMQFQLQQQQMKQQMKLQMQQAQNQGVQQQQQQPQNQGVQQNQGIQQTTAPPPVNTGALNFPPQPPVQAASLGEQKSRYSWQIQQLQSQAVPAQMNQNPTSASTQQQHLQSLHQQAQQLMNRPGSASSRQSFRMGAGTPMSPSNMRPSSTQPMRPPSRPSNAGTPISPSNSMRPSSTQPTRPSSRPSTAGTPVSPPMRPPSTQQTRPPSMPSQQNAIEFPGQTKDFVNFMYKPVSTLGAKNNQASSMSSRGGSTMSTSSAHHVAFNPVATLYPQPSLPNDAFAAITQLARDQKGKRPQSASSQGDSHSSGGVQQTLDAKQTTSTSSAAGGKKTSPQRRNQQLYNSHMTYEQVRVLADQCTTEQKIVWVAKQILGSGNANGFQKAASSMQRIKKQRIRIWKQKEGGSTNEHNSFQEEEEQLKNGTFNVRLAKRMKADMTQGLQFCNLMKDVIRSVLEEVDPENPILTVQPPTLGFPDGGHGPLPSSKLLAPLNRGMPEAAKAATTPEPAFNPNAETVAGGNPKGSTLRKSRERGGDFYAGTDVLLLNTVGDHDDHGNKLSKKDIANRLFEATRFRTLEVGDYVAAKLDSRDLWMLTRVGVKWNAVGTYQQIAGLSDVKKDILFSKQQVFVQEAGAMKQSQLRAVNRQHVLPLPRSSQEANDWGTRIAKNSRVFAMYPGTMALYSGTVTDSRTYCRNQDDMIVMQFDDDEGDNGITPERHIPARFMTLIPREFDASHKPKRRRSTSTDNAAKKRRSTPTFSSQPTGPIQAMSWADRANLQLPK